MAEYPTLAPTLAALNGAKNDPQDTEAASKLAAVDRQSRNWMYDFLSIYIDSTTNKLKPSAFGIGSTIPAGSVRGTNSVDGTQQEIVQGSIRNQDIADNSILGLKLNSGSVNGDRLADNTVNGGKLLDGSITSSKLGAGILTANNIADGAVTQAKLSDGAVGSQKLVDFSVTGPKVGLRAVEGKHLPPALAGQMLVGGNGLGEDELAMKTISGALTIDKDGIAKISSGLAGNVVTFARIAERAAAGTHGGTSVSASWNLRGSAPSQPWAFISTTRDFLDIVGERIFFKEGGKYWVSVAAPIRSNAGGLGLHKVALVYFPDPGNINSPIVHYGLSTDGLVNTTSNSNLQCVLEVDDSKTANLPRPWFYVTHWVGAASGQVTVGLGTAVAITSPPIAVSPPLPNPPELYAEVTILRIQETLATDVND